MMTFHDIKAFIDFASDPKKYKDVVDQLDERQKKWESLVETYTKVEDAAKYLEQVETEATQIKAAAMKASEDLVAKNTKVLEKTEAAKAKLILTQEKVDELKAQLERKTAELDFLLQSAKNDAEVAASKRITLEQQLIATEQLAAEYKEKLDKINTMLKQV